MSKITEVKGSAVPIEGDDIDTDRIIPARYLKEITFSDLGKYAFFDERFDTDGSKKEHPFNDERYKGASILIVNKNFGCGSSREHAPQSLMRHGIKAIIGESFAEIFEGNCTTLGIPTVIASKEDVETLMTFVKEKPMAEISIDLNEGEISYGDFTAKISQKESSKKVLTEGTWDSLSVLLKSSDEIEKTEENLPYSFEK